MIYVKGILCYKFDFNDSLIIPKLTKIGKTKWGVKQTDIGANFEGIISCDTHKTHT